MPCKYMRTKYNWTPNDYNLSFPVEEIPSNVDVQNVKELTLQLQNKTPLGKVIHIELEEKNRNIENVLDIYTTAIIGFDNKEKDVILL